MAVMLIARSLLCVVLLVAAQAERPTIIARPSAPPMRNFSVIHYDDAFLFAARHYGSAADRGGNTEPGLFVHSKQADRWIQVTAISTAGGRFGKSVSDEPEAAKRLMASSVSWNFTAAASEPYVQQPLRTSGSIAFPEIIELDAPNDRYVLRYLTSFKVPAAEVVLYVKRSDLNAAFRNPG